LKNAYEKMTNYQTWKIFAFTENIFKIEFKFFWQFIFKMVSLFYSCAAHGLLQFIWLYWNCMNWGT